MNGCDNGFLMVQFHLKPFVGACALAAVVAAGCGSTNSTDAADTGGAAGETSAATTAPNPAATADAGTNGGDAQSQRFPDVIDASAEPTGDTWRISATLSSPYDTPDRYADAWRVLDPDGNELAVRVLTHDHASEQPFTRSLSGVEIPAGTTTVTIEGRDLTNGWGGETFQLTLPSPTD